MTTSTLAGATGGIRRYGDGPRGGRAQDTRCCPCQPGGVVRTPRHIRSSTTVELTRGVENIIGLEDVAAVNPMW